MIKLRLRHWYSVLDAEQFAAMRDIKGWTIVALFILCGLLMGSVVPVTRDFFQTEFLPVFTLWWLMIAFALIDGLPVFFQPTGINDIFTQ